MFQLMANSAPTIAVARTPTPWARRVNTTAHVATRVIARLTRPSETASSNGSIAATQGRAGRLVNGANRQVTCSSSRGVPEKRSTIDRYCWSSTDTGEMVLPDDVVYGRMYSVHSLLTTRSCTALPRSRGIPVQSKRAKRIDANNSTPRLSTSATFTAVRPETPCDVAVVRVMCPRPRRI